MIHTSAIEDVEIPTVSVTDYVLESAARLGDKPALIDGTTGRVLTYAQLAQDSGTLAEGLRANGFGRGDVLALAAPNGPGYPVVLHAVALLGGVVTTVNPAYTEREVHHQLIDSGARMLVTVEPLLALMAAASEETPVTEVLVIGEAPAGSAIRAISDLMGPTVAGQVPVDPEDTVVLPYSSGTTGVNKGVMLTHRNLVANIAQTLGAIDLNEGDSFVAVLPFFHIYGLQVLLNTGLRAGATIITMPRFDLEQYLQLHADHRPTRGFVAPPIVVALAKHPIVDSYDLSSLQQIFSAAAPLSAELAIEAGTRLGCEVVQGYGLTELSPVSHITRPGQSKPGSVGVTVPNTEVRIVDPATGSDVDVDLDGEVYIRGPQVMKGYLNNESATSNTIDGEGWLHTGDIGRMDGDGHLFIVDRLKELIKHSGFQVAPAELEALLLTHPSVADAAVIGRPDEATGEIPVAFVVLRPGQDVTGEEIAAFVAGQVAHYKQLGEVVFIDAVPKSASGKILRRLLRDTPAT